jgi:hypothetical protein
LQPQPTQLQCHTGQNLHCFTFYTKRNKPVKSSYQVFSGHITVAFQVIDYGAISVKQMTVKHSTVEGVVIDLFLITLARNQKAPEILKLTSFCNMVTKVEAQCYNCQCRPPHCCLWCGGETVPT